MRNRVIAALALLLLWPAMQLSAASGNSVAFFYGANPPVNALSQFDRLILESENIKADELEQLKRNGAATFAYLSIGEVGSERDWYSSLAPEATLGTNEVWNSKVMDLASPEWQRFVLRRVNRLVADGYDGLFLDTMDSYQLYATTEAERTKQEAGLTRLLARVKKQHPQIRLIANRGFEVIDKIATQLEAVAAESLYAGWNNGAQAYQPVAENDRSWLLAKLTNIKKQHGIDVIVIDYLPPARRSESRDVAARIAAKGFIPWVANPSLDYVGVSTLEVIPRDVLMVYDSSVSGDIESTEVHSLLAMPLEYMGFVPVYHDIKMEGLPTGILKGSHAGIVMWNRGHIEMANYDAWLATQFKQQIPVAIFGSLGTNLTPEFAEAMGVAPVNHFDRFSLKPDDYTSMIGFEASPPRRIDQIAMSLRSESRLNTTHLSFKDKNGVALDSVITGPWGGLALHPTIVELGVDPVRDWIIDPFAFLKKSLQLPDAPMPDITTENGHRLWFAHIDGDAMPSWAELPGRRLGSQVINDEILKPYDLPHTISIVEAEMNGMLAFADRRGLMEKTAREIFALDNVEIATHSYSHPFDWFEVSSEIPSGRYNLPIPGYRYSLEREIGGSAKYIDEVLAPPGKKTKVMLWTGKAIPPAEAFAIADKHGLVNMNGGNTVISKAMPTVALISANSRVTDGWLQVYAPIMNENVFTNEWTGPFDGFRRVIETLEMTDKPRRIKPANVYYHFYAGTKQASLRSLEEIYDWSVAQEIHPVFSSEYIDKVAWFRSAGVAKHLDGRWKISGLGSIRSLRILKQNAWPNLASSRALAGARRLHDGVYIHTNGASNFTFTTQSVKPKQPHLVASNAKIDQWHRNANGQIKFKLSGHAPVTFKLGGDQRYCDVRHGSKKINGQPDSNGDTQYVFTTKDTGDAVIDCKT